MPSVAIKAPQRELTAAATPLARSRGLNLRLVAGLLGLLSLGTFLCSHNVADGDLWAKLALGAHVWKHGGVPVHDMFAFTPALPLYVDHEWGAGTIFFGLLDLFGPGSLMWLKIVLCFGTVAAALVGGRRAGCGWGPLLLLAIPSVACVVLGYIPVIRSHAFTYFFFAATLLFLEEIRTTTPLRTTGLGRFWPILGTFSVMLLWVNIHGGFVAGLGTMAIYLSIASLEQSLVANGVPGCRKADRRSAWKPLLVILLGCLLITCVNPYGTRFWFYLLPAVLAKRPFITEWRPLPLLGNDAFVSFRILFLLVAVAIVTGWKNVQKRSWTGLAMLTVTAVLAWRSRRHAPFFGVAAMAFLGPYVAGTLARIKGWATTVAHPLHDHSNREQTAAGQLNLPQTDPSAALVAIYAVITIYAAVTWLPRSSFEVLAPVGHDPVREVDILSLAQAKGNVATPFHWGSYCAWRLFPNMRISMDGRYEAAFPESTFMLNERFFDKAGADWDRLVRDYPVDYIILDLSQPGLKPEDLKPYGYSLVWVSEGCSALMALREHVPHLSEIAGKLPPTTIDPLDATIPARWWPSRL